MPRPEQRTVSRTFMYAQSLETQMEMPIYRSTHAEPSLTRVT